VRPPMLPGPNACQHKFPITPFELSRLRSGRFA